MASRVHSLTSNNVFNILSKLYKKERHVLSSLSLELFCQSKSLLHPHSFDAYSAPDPINISPVVNSTLPTANKCQSHQPRQPNLTKTN